jgi:hypothetical protein
MGNPFVAMAEWCSLVAELPPDAPRSLILPAGFCTSEDLATKLGA